MYLLTDLERGKSIKWIAWANGICCTANNNAKFCHMYSIHCHTKIAERVNIGEIL